MLENGVIFRDEADDIIWFGVYQNGTVVEFNELQDYNGEYEDLPSTSVVLVDIKNEISDRIKIKEVCILEVVRHVNDGTVEKADVSDMLNELNFPSEDSDDMFASFLTELNVLH